LQNFLKTHVWTRWDDRTKSFMTLVSVASELTPELCEWLAADEKTLKKASGAELLAKLTRENAFLRKTGADTYRFHDLFRDFLLHMLEARGERAAAAQWNRAGDYYFNKKDCFRSLEYYLKGKNDGGVAESLYCMYDYNSPYASIEDTLYAIHMSVNDSIVEKYPFLLEVQAWAAYVEGRAKDFERYLDTYHGMFSKIVLQNPRSAIIHMILPALDYRQNFADVCGAIRKVPLKGIFKGSIKAYTPSVTINMPFCHRSLRDFSELTVDDAEKQLSLAEKTFGLVMGAEFSVLRHCLYAGFHYEKGSHDKACEYALAACANIPEGCSPEIKFCAMMILTAALMADNRQTEAEKILGKITSMIEHDKAFYLKSNLRAYLCRLKLTNGERAAAEEWLKDHTGNIYDTITFYKLYQNFTTARAYIVIGDYNHAVLHLQKLLKLSERYRRPLDVIEAQILLAVAYWKKGRGGLSVAMDYLERAVAAAHEYGYTQVFAGEGAELVNMLHKLQKRAVQKEHARGLSGTFIKTLYIAALSESKRTKGLTGGLAPQNLTFTDKQKTVMRLMCEGCSRNAIAERMGLTPNGVKTHMELIYKKLDVMNSDEAIMKIKELGALSPGEGHAGLVN